MSTKDALVDSLHTDVLSLTAELDRARAVALHPFGSMPRASSADAFQRAAVRSDAVVR